MAPRPLAIMCMLHLFLVAVSTFTMTFENNPSIIASMLALLTWICIWLSIIAAQLVYVWTCDLLHYIRVSLSSRLATATLQPFTRAFYPSVGTQPIPPADVMPEDRPVTMIGPVQEEVTATSVRNNPPIGPEQQGESLVIYADSFALITCRYSG